MGLLSEHGANVKGFLDSHPTWRTWGLACGLALVLFALCVGMLMQAGGRSDDQVPGNGSSGAVQGPLTEPDGAAGGDLPGAAGEPAGAIGGAVGGAVVDGASAAGQAEGQAPAGEDGAQAETSAQANAFVSAKLHMSEMPYSHAGLRAVLEAEGYSSEDATYAVDKLGVDWNVKAAEMAAQYVDTMEFTREDLIDQLVYEGFTHEQAEAGVAAIGM